MTLGMNSDAFETTTWYSTSLSFRIPHTSARIVYLVMVMLFPANFSNDGQKWLSGTKEKMTGLLVQ